ncbi:NADP-dependent oxidoreductase [Brevibacterium sp. 'Marine']|uniref:NADP-dependent oxidoreductase n=1 Tax=Brevibacterium sp. 'Marine' TaxID=2725563 RepID=UPI00145D7406|nr:NADP-dependent oxidoreductase [Brevibacterium sp. 'Marine']
MNTEAMMRAVSQQTFGSADVLEITEIPRPEPRPNEILVKVQAAGLNPTDWKHRSGRGFIDTLPLVLGWDVSGVVEDVGIGVATFKPGDEVFGMLSYPFGLGSHAEYVATPSRFFAAKPRSVDHVQAGALPLVSLTAWQALVENADVQSGQRVLIHAAAGGVGHIAVQIAKARGAYVIGTASAEKHGFLRELGADEVIDYRTDDFADRVRDVDAVLDTIGGDTAMRSLHTLRKGGCLVSLIPVGSADLLREADQLGVRALRMLVDSSRSTLEIVSGLVDDGALRATIAGTFPLTEAAEAHREGETNRTTGKLVLTMDE